MTTDAATDEGLKVRRSALLAARRPAGVVIGELGRCRRSVRRNLADPTSPKVPCGAVTAWRLDGEIWCPRCWSAAPEGLAVLAKLDGTGSEGDR